jgi:hypothetical protein
VIVFDSDVSLLQQELKVIIFSQNLEALCRGRRLFKKDINRFDEPNRL